MLLTHIFACFEAILIYGIAADELFDYQGIYVKPNGAQEVSNLTELLDDLPNVLRPPSSVLDGNEVFLLVPAQLVSQFESLTTKIVLESSAEFDYNSEEAMLKSETRDANYVSKTSLPIYQNVIYHIRGKSGCFLSVDRKDNIKCEENSRGRWYVTFGKRGWAWIRHQRERHKYLHILSNTTIELSENQFTRFEFRVKDAKQYLFEFWPRKKDELMKVEINNTDPIAYETEFNVVFPSPRFTLQLTNIKEDNFTTVTTPLMLVNSVLKRMFTLKTHVNIGKRQYIGSIRSLLVKNAFFTTLYTPDLRFRIVRYFGERLLQVNISREETCKVFTQWITYQLEYVTLEIYMKFDTWVWYPDEKMAKMVDVVMLFPDIAQKIYQSAESVPMENGTIKLIFHDPDIKEYSSFTRLIYDCKPVCTQ